MEVEAKFQVPDQKTFDKLLETTGLAGYRLGPGRIKRVRDRYLDTADFAFLQEGFACRVRSSGAASIVTLKSLTPARGATHSREELEMTLPPASSLEIPSWPAGLLRDLAGRLSHGQPLALLFELRQERQIRLITRAVDGRAVAEFSLDKVRLTGAGGAEILELEIELLPEGRDEDLQALVRALQDGWQLPAESRSKFERGLAAARPELLAHLSPVEKTVHGSWRMA